MIGPRLGRMAAVAVALGSVAILGAGSGTPAVGVAQNDGASGGDAGDTFATATAIAPVGEHAGSLDLPGRDHHDWYRFFLAEGASITLIIQPRDTPITEPIELVDPEGRPVDVGVMAHAGVSASTALTHETQQLRLAVHHAVMAGEYRLHLQSSAVDTGRYLICFNNCEKPLSAPIDMIFGGSLRQAETRVLLLPPAHGDLGNPGGPTVFEYIDATLRGLRRWPEALSAFADAHPEYSYLKDITVDIEVFDGVSPLDFGQYDVVVGYVAAGPVFRGVASDLGVLGYTSNVFGGRVIALSLFGGSPRAGQGIYDFPELADLENVTMHEFGHTFGLGHTRTWHAEHGPDLMNSPATFVYGDGWAAGDGGERTALDCFSTLDLFGMAHLYRWMPTGEWQGSYGSVDLPRGIPYSLVC